VNNDKKSSRPIVRTSLGQTDYKRELAYRCLGMDPKTCSASRSLHSIETYCSLGPRR